MSKMLSITSRITSTPLPSFFSHGRTDPRPSLGGARRLVVQASKKSRKSASREVMEKMKSELLELKSLKAKVSTLTDQTVSGDGFDSADTIMNGGTETIDHTVDISTTGDSNGATSSPTDSTTKNESMESVSEGQVALKPNPTDQSEMENKENEEEDAEEDSKGKEEDSPRESSDVSPSGMSSVPEESTVAIASSEMTLTEENTLKEIITEDLEATSTDEIEASDEAVTVKLSIDEGNNFIGVDLQIGDEGNENESEISQTKVSEEINVEVVPDVAISQTLVSFVSDSSEDVEKILEDSSGEGSTSVASVTELETIPDASGNGMSDEILKEESDSAKQENADVLNTLSNTAEVSETLEVPANLEASQTLEFPMTAANSETKDGSDTADVSASEDTGSEMPDAADWTVDVVTAEDPMDQNAFGLSLNDTEVPESKMPDAADWTVDTATADPTEKSVLELSPDKAVLSELDSAVSLKMPDAEEWSTGANEESVDDEVGESAEIVSATSAQGIDVTSPEQSSIDATEWYGATCDDSASESTVFESLSVGDSAVTDSVIDDSVIDDSVIDDSVIDDSVIDDSEGADSSNGVKSLNEKIEVSEEEIEAAMDEIELTYAIEGVAAAAAMRTKLEESEEDLEDLEENIEDLVDPKEDSEDLEDSEEKPAVADSTSKPSFGSLVDLIKFENKNLEMASSKLSDKLRNFRDLASCDSENLKKYKIYRCADPTTTTEVTAEVLCQVIGTKFFLDLRAPDEVETLESPLLNRVNTLNYSRKIKPDQWKSKVREAIEEPDPTRVSVSILNYRRFYDRLRARMPQKWQIDVKLAEVFNGKKANEMYMSELNKGGLKLLNEIVLDTSGPEIGACMNLILQAAQENAPVVVFCRAGKDRTGLISALILACCGIDPKIIKDDYTLSGSESDSQLGGGNVDRAVLPGDLDKEAFRGAPREVMENTLSYLETAFGSPSEYLAKNGFPKESQDALKDTLVS